MYDFAKWREVYTIGERNPTMLARYAAAYKEQVILPIVEPEVLNDCSYSMARCAEVTETVHKKIFHALHRHHIVLAHTIHKPNMILPGKD